jgi:hypothetical protein
MPPHSESDKNNMRAPHGNEPLQNLVVQPVAAGAQNPAAGAAPPPAPPPAPPQAPGGNQPIQMTAAERIGLNNIINEFHHAYHNNFAPQIQEIQGFRGLERILYIVCRDIDTKHSLGYDYNQILQSDPLLRHIAMSASFAIHPNIATFDQLSFNLQMFLMNLVVFVLRYLARNPNQH